MFCADGSIHYCWLPWASLSRAWTSTRHHHGRCLWGTTDDRGALKGELVSIAANFCILSYQSSARAWIATTACHCDCDKISKRHVQASPPSHKTPTTLGPSCAISPGRELPDRQVHAVPSTTKVMYSEEDLSDCCMARRPVFCGYEFRIRS